MLTFGVNKNRVSSKVLSIINKELDQYYNNSKNYKENNSKILEWTSEVYFKATIGKIEEELNMGFYSNVCSTNCMKSKVQREQAMIDEKDIYNGVKGVSINSIFSIDEIDELNFDLDIEILDFIELTRTLFVEEGVYLPFLINSAFEGDKKSIDKLKDLVFKYNLEDLMLTLFEDTYKSDAKIKFRKVVLECLKN